MRLHNDVSLASRTTFRMGGTVARLWCPQNENDLLELPRTSAGGYLVLSGGSNILANDASVFPDVVYMGDFDDRIDPLGGGRYFVGCSARIQSVIKKINSEGYGGIEELVSIPGMLGGLVCMNASVPSAGTCISDYLVSVDVFDGKKTVAIAREECNFGYRSSRFQNGHSIILSAIFQFPEQDPRVSSERIQNRKAYVKATQDNSLPNFGSVFKQCNSKIMSTARRLGITKGGARFSVKTNNWLLNDGATFNDAIGCIKKIQIAHRFLRRPCELEVVVWE